MRFEFEEWELAMLRNLQSAGAPLAAALFSLAAASAASAATCGTNVGANQNYYDVTGASSCYATGTGQINQPTDQPFGPASLLVYLDKTGATGDLAEGSLTVDPGLWSITPPSGYTNFVLLFEQSNSPREPDWAAFLLDALTGTWGITGSNGMGVFSSKTLSHAILYGEPVATPIPGALVLFGSALSLLAGFFGWFRRRAVPVGA
jgi:hypothetical protein